MEYGAGKYLEKDIILFGDDFIELKIKKFDIDRKTIQPYKKKNLTKFFDKYVVQKPYIIEKDCLGCGICVSICPVKPK